MLRLETYRSYSSHGHIPVVEGLVKGYCAFKHPIHTLHIGHGPLDFALTGILSRIATALARAGVSIFAISTFDTDYVLVPSADAEKARSALTASGTCRFTDP